MAETIKASEWTQRARELRDDGFLLMDLCGLDRLGIGGHGRFEVVAQFLNRERKQWVTVHVPADGDPPAVSSVVDVFPTVDFMEREAYDMFGIAFEGHPDLTRILMPEAWEGHPLRKDYGVGKVPIEFIPQPYLQVDAPGQAPDPVEAGGGVDRLGQAGAARRDLGGAPGASSYPPSEEAGP